MPSKTIRYVAAFICVVTVAWDYCRWEETLFSFSTWVLLIQFVYFQLPLNSDAVSFFHPCAFVGSCAIPMAYLYLLWVNPFFELNHIDLWDVSLQTIIIRSALVHFAPMVFHTLDMTINQAHIIASYQKKPKSFMCLWALTSFALFGLLFEVFMVVTNSTFGTVTDDEELDVSTVTDENGYGSSSSMTGGMGVYDRADAAPDYTTPVLFGEVASTEATTGLGGNPNLASFLYHSRMFSLIGATFALFILYSMILKRAYFRSHLKTA